MMSEATWSTHEVCMSSLYIQLGAPEQTVSALAAGRTPPAEVIEGVLVPDVAVALQQLVPFLQAPSAVRFLSAGSLHHTLLNCTLLTDIAVALQQLV